MRVAAQTKLERGLSPLGLKLLVVIRNKALRLYKGLHAQAYPIPYTIQLKKKKKGKEEEIKGEKSEEEDDLRFVRN